MPRQDLYTALQKFSFKTDHIEEAMKSSVLYGGDLHSALDWLCLNLKDGRVHDLWLALATIPHCTITDLTESPPSPPNTPRGAPRGVQPEDAGGEPQDHEGPVPAS